MNRLRRVIFAGLACTWLVPTVAAAEPIVLVNPVLDESDRLAEILGRLEPRVAIQQVGIEILTPPVRAVNPGEEVRLDDAKLVILENAPHSALSQLGSQGSFVDDLLAWSKKGGHLLVVGGTPGFATEPGPLRDALPVVLEPDPEGKAFLRKRLKRLRGAADVTMVSHLHSTRSVRGEVLLSAGDAPLAVTGAFGRGRVTVVLSGTHGQLYGDGGPTERDFFASPAWSQFVTGEVGKALGSRFELRPAGVALGSIPAVRRGSRLFVSDWFGGRSSGKIVFRDPAGRVVTSLTPGSGGSLQLPEEMRPGLYEVTREGRQSESRQVLIGEPADPHGFDIRYFMLGNPRYPYGLAAGEAYARARELVEAGFTSAVYYSRARNRKDNLRGLHELAHAGLEIIYYRSMNRHAGPFPRWSLSGRAPMKAKNPEGAEFAWDVHDDAFRAGFAELLEGRARELTVPGIRALQLIEEFADGGMTSPSLRPLMKKAGIQEGTRRGRPDWYAAEDIRSQATAETFRSFRAVGNRLLPGVPLTSYWPGSYWNRTSSYTFRVEALAANMDELHGPGYGYQYGVDAGWLSVVDSAADIFAAHGHRLAEGRGTAVYAQGITLGRAELPISPSAWPETSWTALAHGATGLAYWALPWGGAMAQLVEHHAEVSRIGPWIAAAQRRPAQVAVLGSWSTRTAATLDEKDTQAACIHNLLSVLTLGTEEVDVILEEQLSDPPEALRAIVASKAPVLTEEAVDALTAFTERGGHLLVDAKVATRTPEGARRRAPWERAKRTGRVVELAGNACARAAQATEIRASEWRRRLEALGISPTSDTPGIHSEARMLGDDEIRYWMILNHAEKPDRVTARTSSSGSAFTWVDLRSGDAASFQRDPTMKIEREIGARDVAVLLGVRRPAATLTLTARRDPHRVLVEVRAQDGEGRAVADGYPLALDARDAKGAALLHAARRSRVTRDGAATWSVPIPLTTGEELWSLEASEPVAGRRASAPVQIPSVEAQIPDTHE